MAIAKFTQVVSFFKTTLAQRLTDSATDVVLAAVPGGVVEYPTWAVIEPQGDNRELIYLPAAPSTLTYSTVVRGLDPQSNNDTLAATFNKEHPANVEVIIAPTHRHWNELVKVMDGTVGTGANVLRIGDETDVDVTIYAQNADASKPYLQYDSATNKWLISNDGTSTFDISAGGSGLTRGPGVDVVASAITLDVRTSGGLRNNQGTGSAQCDVDPTVVARLDTANAWAAVQTVSADNLQISSDADSANDAVRNSLMDARIPAGAVTGTSGEAISVGQGVYVKASDSKYYKTAGTAAESTFSFAGVALTAAAGADTSFTFAPPGHIVTTSGLTAGAFYFVTDTAGTLGTTPGTRFARVGLALSTTQLLVTVPKYKASGTQTITSATTFVQTTGFYPGVISIRAARPDDGFKSGASVGDDANTCIAFRMVGANNDAVSISDKAWYVYDINATLLENAGEVSARSATGFTLNCTTYSSTANVQWTAESL